MNQGPIMKVTYLILVTICVVVCGDESAQSSSIVSKAVISVIDNYFAKEYPQVDMYICGQKFGPSEDLVNEILRLKSDNVKIRIFGVENQEIFLSTSSIILFDSVQKFKKFVDDIEERRRKTLPSFGVHPWRYDQ